MNAEILRQPRRRHSKEFKQEVVGACCEPGTSIARVALHYGLNANQVRRWVVEHGATPASRRAPRMREQTPVTAVGFVPVQVAPPNAPSPDIRIEVHRGATRVMVSWPAQAAGECADWLRAWLG